MTRDRLLYEISHMTDTSSERVANDVQKFSKRELLAIHSYIALTDALVNQMRERLRQLERSCSVDR